MNTGKKVIGLIAITVLLGASQGFAYDKKMSEADNTRVNKTKTLSAQNQSSKKNDVEITRKIRRQFMKEKNFSTNAQNIKIITRNGKVHLKGPVQSSVEKKRAEKIAMSIAGATAVKSDLQITKK